MLNIIIALHYVHCLVEFTCHSIATDKDVLRTDRDLPMYNDVSSVKLIQLEHILRTYVMYNFDLGELEPT